LNDGGLPLGLATGIKLKHDIALGEMLSWTNVEVNENDQAVRHRREMEAVFGLPNS
jgi:predicted homoserine dehydrogenase-like protein